jgi:hypothetical protein
MRIQRLARLLLICLALHCAVVRGDEPFPAISPAAVSAQSPPGIAFITPVVDTTEIPPNLPPDRPTELPNIHPSDLPPLLKQPAAAEPKKTPAVRKPFFGEPRSDYDPSRLFLPDRNPGLRQPPCPCLPLGTWWINASYFLGITQNENVPNLAVGGGGTTSVLNPPPTHVLFGGGPVDHPFRSGLNLESGVWLDRCHDWGVEGSFFFLASDQQMTETSASGSSIVGRPFINAATGGPAALVLQNPSSFSTSSPISFLGAGVNLRGNLFCEDNYRIDFTGGYRFIYLDESFSATSTETFSTGGIRLMEDTFNTANQFHGLQIGLAGEYRIGDFYLDGAVKTAFGVTFANLNTEGHTTSMLGTIATTTGGGFLTGPSNLGQWNYSRFCAVPEATFRIGYQLTEHWRTFVGYNVIYMTQVARPGQAIDPTIGTTPAGIVHPEIRDPVTSFWMQGINLGLEARY